jgi:hypothetical protein
MQIGNLREVAETVAVDIEKATRERVQRRQGRRDKRVAGAGCRESFQCKMEPEVKQSVVILGRPAELLSNSKVYLTFWGAGTSSGKDGDEALKLTPWRLYLFRFGRQSAGVLFRAVPG